MTDETHRYYVRSPDGRMITGYDRPDAAKAVALDYGEGAVVVDTLAQAYYPAAEEVIGGELLHAGVAGWNAGKSDPSRDLIEAIRKGHPAVVHAFLKKGSAPDSRDANGGTALHWAASRGNAEIARLLLDAGADAAATDGEGDTSLDVARSKGKAKLVNLLSGIVSG
ncbi:MAG: ankyrin repeat domain-containing protein [Proteobacteria bacterium]|nr:ankyrin repeat domain-containing protein [Pseudomonadota bacterium]MCK4867330.1 ankyrin repeat domain-containing protein [Alphaproteobacteria bacterium]